MNRSLMNKDLHSPAFIRASVPADKEEPLQVASKTTSSNGINGLASSDSPYLWVSYRVECTYSLS